MSQPSRPFNLMQSRKVMSNIVSELLEIVCRKVIIMFRLIHCSKRSSMQLR